MEQSNLSYKDVTSRPYMLGEDVYVKYQNRKKIISSIKKGLNEFVFADPAVRIILNNEKSNSVNAVLGLPFSSQKSKLLDNFATLIYHPIMGYYIQDDIQTSHSGISNLLIEGNFRNLLRREAEKLIALTYKRGDIAGRLLKNIEINESVKRVRSSSNFIHETIRDGLEINIGYRMFTRGEGVNPVRVFLPIAEGSSVINQIFKNLEDMLLYAFNIYDEIGSKHFEPTENLIFNYLESILNRSKEKEYTRKKILQKLIPDWEDKAQNRVYRDIFYGNNDDDRSRMKYAGSGLKGKSTKNGKRSKAVGKSGKLSKIEREEEHLKIPGRPQRDDAQLATRMDDDKPEIKNSGDKKNRLTVKKESLQELDE